MPLKEEYLFTCCRHSALGVLIAASLTATTLHFFWNSAYIKQKWIGREYIMWVWYDGSTNMPRALFQDIKVELPLQADP